MSLRCNGQIKNKTKNCGGTKLYEVWYLNYVTNLDIEGLFRNFPNHNLACYFLQPEIKPTRSYCNIQLSVLRKTNIFLDNKVTIKIFLFRWQLDSDRGIWIFNNDMYVNQYNKIPYWYGVRGWIVPKELVSFHNWMYQGILNT